MSTTAPMRQAGSSADGACLLQVDGLVSSHGGPFTLAVAAGECVAIVGRSGSGKSVLLRLIADLDPHAGEVRLGGRARSSWSAPEWRRQVIYQAAEPAWWAPTGRAHFAAERAPGPATTSSTPREGTSKAAEPPRLSGFAALHALLLQLGLEPAQLDVDISRLSTGERQRLALARSLSRAPRVLLLDEPTAALDATTTLAVEALLATHVAAGMPVLFVTHSHEQAERVGHRLLEVRDHRIHSP